MAGRPQKPINWTEVEKRVEMGQNGSQISRCLHIDSDTFYERFRAEYGYYFSEYSAKNPICRSENILFVQYIKALQGNVKLLELLGKEWCGQGQSDIIVSPKQEQIDQTHTIMKLEHELELLRANANKSQTE